MRCFALALVAGVLLSGISHAAEPAGWRGSGGGRYPDAQPPTEWSADKHVRWKVDLPGRSRPCAFARERADVHLVDHLTLGHQARP